MVPGEPVPDVGPRGVAPDPAARWSRSTSSSGLNFPVGRLGLLGALAISTIPLAVGLDAMRQLAFAGSAYPVGTPPPEVEALILVAMTVVFMLPGPLMLRAIERMARHEGRLSVRWHDDAPGGPAHRLRLRRPSRIGVRPSAHRPGADSRTSGAAFRTAVRLGWQIEANWTDPVLFFIYSVAKPIASALILVVMLEVIGGAAPGASSAASWSSAARCGRS